VGDEHMSWCTGQHTDQGECAMSRTVQLGEPAEVLLSAAPCSDGQAGLWVSEAWIYELSDLDRLIATLTELRPVLEAAFVEADCELHEHPEDDEDDDDD
jgi:hypothetical protein